jgi:hypothetical protein
VNKEIKTTENSDKMVFGLMVGILYMLFGMLQFIVGIGFNSKVTTAMFIRGDIIGGLILVLFGIVFIFGYRELRRGISEGVAYIYIGIFLALIFLLIYLLMIVANALEAYLILSEEFSGWTPLDDLNPGIYLGIISLIGFIIWRNKFSLARKTKEVKND